MKFDRRLQFACGRRISILSCLIASLVFCICNSAEAQRRYRYPYYPSRPTISPYTQLFGPNIGGTNNYFDIVRPRLQARQAIDQLQRQTDFLYQNQSMMLEMAPRAGFGLRPSTAATFMDTRGYFGTRGYAQPIGVARYPRRPLVNASTGFRLGRGSF